MLSRNLRATVVFCGVAAVVVGSPSKGYAIFDWLCPWSGKQQAQSTTYVPPFSGRPVAWAPRSGSGPVAAAVAPRPAPAGAVATTMPATCTYVPQTCYRTVTRLTPVTSCTAAYCCDPCTGCPVVTYRPVTSWAYRTVLVPYTAYRIVYANPCAPMATRVGACGTSSAAPSPVNPSAPPVAAPPPRISPVPMSGLPSPPSPAVGIASPPPPTFGAGQQVPRPKPAEVRWSGSGVEAPKGSNPPWPETRLMPVPQEGPAAAPVSPPKLNAPNNDRTAAVTIHQASYLGKASGPSGGNSRVTLRLDATAWKPVE